MSRADDRLKWVHRRKGVVSCSVHLKKDRATKNPIYVLAGGRIERAIAAALDPVKVPSKGRGLADMTPKERAAIEQEYGAPIVDVDGKELVEVAVNINVVRPKAVRVKQRQPNGREFTVAWIPREVVANAYLKVGPVVLYIPQYWAKKKKLRYTLLRKGDENVEGQDGSGVHSGPVGVDAEDHQ